MIALHSDCLLFQLTNGESVPCSAEMISVEIVGTAAASSNPKLLRHAAASVFHYFKVELERETVTVGEFSLALEKVLRHLGFTIHAGAGRHPEISRHRPRPAHPRSRRRSGTFFLPAPARRAARPAPPVAARRAVSRPAPLRETDCRRPPLELALRTASGPNRGIPPPVHAQRGRKARLRARGGIVFNFEFLVLS